MRHRFLGMCKKDGRPSPNFMLLLILSATMLLLLVGPASLPAQEERPASFGSYEGYTGPAYDGLVTTALYIPMRDGVRIAVDLMLPKNLPEGEKIPAIIKMTRYWRAAELRPPMSWLQRPDEFERFFTSNGYALLYVDARGSGASFGSRPHPWSKSEVLDGGDIVDWIVAQPWSNGRVGTIGTSYAGTAAEFFATLNNPAVKAVIPRFADNDVYIDIAYPGGIPNEWMLKNWAYYNHQLDSNIVPKEIGLMGRLFVRGVKPVDSDRGRRLLREAVSEHADNGDVYKLSRNTTYRNDPGNEQGTTVDDFSPHSFIADIERSGVGVYSWGSWMDAAQANAVIRRFINYSNPQRAVIGPWSHGGGDHASPFLPSNTPTDPSTLDQLLDCVRFFDYYLKDIDNGIMSEKVLVYYTMGEEKWKSTNVWPPAGSTSVRWYLDAHNSLSRNKPATEDGTDFYAVDYEATTGATNRWHTQMGGDVIYPDRATEDTHLLTYTSQPMSEDTEITGYPIVTLYITSTHGDGAFFVYLEDVDENGRVTYLTEGQLRALHRNISEDPQPYKMPAPYHSFRQADGAPLIPDEMTRISFGLHPTSVLIRQGHRIRVAIAGADKDTFARIPAEGTPVLNVERNSLRPSYIDLPVIRKP